MLLTKYRRASVKYIVPVWVHMSTSVIPILNRYGFMRRMPLSHITNRLTFLKPHALTTLLRCCNVRTIIV